MAKKIIITDDIVIPVLPLRDVVIFPHTIVPLFVGRVTSVNAVLDSLNNNKEIFLVAQKKDKADNIIKSDIYKIGVVAKILQMTKLPDRSIKILIEGEYRAKIISFKKNNNNNFYYAGIEKLEKLTNDSLKTIAVRRLVSDSFAYYAKISDKVSSDALKVIEKIDNCEHFINIIIANFNLSINKKQQLLESNDVKYIFNQLLLLLKDEIEILKAEKKINTNVRQQMDNNQREYYLNEKLKSIKKELGVVGDESEINNLKKAVKKAKMSKEALKKANDEIKKLERTLSSSSDYSVIQTYVETLCKVPWHKKTTISKDLKQAKKILDSYHCGLNKVKERIIEYLAVQTRTDNKSNILCLVGAPGVGKTSLGKAISAATDRKYVRMALGGIRDEAEIRGHRRTYIGAMPGTVIQKIQKAKVKNPLFLFDEIDKLAADVRSDPSSALLEVLDPEQNHTFNDHYLEVDYDLSEVMFVATANSLNIPPALLDRMEIIHLEGYTEDEKLDIAKKHLIKKQIKSNGLKEKEISISDSAILQIIRYYTREAGVRDLSRNIEKICRKVLTEWIVKQRNKKALISSKNLTKYLGIKKYRFGLAEDKNQIGEVTGLAWTSVGGDLLTIEANAYKGKGKLNYTGQLGDVMKESIQAAMSVIRVRADKLNIETDFYKKLDIHIHVPDGSTPKDGPSAGAAMCVAMVSVLTNRKVKADVAMTGEITLRGEITPIGGLKEKLLAALRGGIKTVIIPSENDRELTEISNKIKDSLNIVKAKWIDEVLDIILEK